MTAVQYSFWFSATRGLIRQRRAPGALWHPEVWNGRHWTTGSPYVMDAITGLGEDVWSSGEAADAWSEAQALEYARLRGIDLYAANGDPPRR
jgi:hypothetical protein